MPKLRFAVAMVVILGAMAIFSSCTRRLLDFTIVSSKNTNTIIPPEGMGERVTGKDSVPVILIPMGRPSIDEAIDRAIEAAGPGYDALIDGVLYEKFHAFIFGKMIYEVEGTAVKTSTLNSSMNGQNSSELAWSGPILYHSRLKRANNGAIKEIGVVAIR